LGAGSTEQPLRLFAWTNTDYCRRGGGGGAAGGGLNDAATGGDQVTRPMWRAGRATDNWKRVVEDRVFRGAGANDGRGPYGGIPVGTTGAFESYRIENLLGCGADLIRSRQMKGINSPVKSRWPTASLATWLSKENGCNTSRATRLDTVFASKPTETVRAA